MKQWIDLLGMLFIGESLSFLCVSLGWMIFEDTRVGRLFVDMVEKKLEEKGE